MYTKPTSFDRLCQLRDWIKIKYPKITEAAIERKLGVATNYFKTRNKAPMGSGNKWLRSQTIENVREAWAQNEPKMPPLNINWLIKGEGEMFLKDFQEVPTHGIPCYNADFFQSGQIENILRKEPEYYISIPPYNQSDVICVSINGDSMAPAINAGDMIIIQKLPLSDSMIYGEIYAIITFSGMCTVRRVIRSNEKENIRLIPENKDPRYGDYQDIPKTSIKNVFKVLCSLRAF